MEWPPFKWLCWNTNDSIAELTIYIKIGGYLFELVIKIFEIMTAITNSEKCDKIRVDFGWL